MQVVVYARVSSREQEREGYSIPAQLKLLEEYAQRNDMNILETFSEAETAKTTGREEFNRMLDFIRRSQDVNTILVEKTDRLYRNFKDYVLLEELDVEVHFVKEGEILSKDSRSHVKFIHGIKVLMAKNYIDNLSEEVKKGQLEKARKGHYPLVAPYGYKNNKETRMIAVDETEALWVRRMYELYATGNYSLNALREVLYEEGMRFRPSQPKIHKSTLSKMLQNIIYTGDFIYRESFYKGKHKPIVSLSLYQQVQEAFDLTNRPKKTKQEFAFAGLMTCGVCGCAMTPQIQKQKYVYYHCSQGRGECKSRYIREEEIAVQFANALKRLKMNDETLNWVIPILKSSHQEEREFHEARVRELRERYDKLSKRIELIYEDKLDGKIPEELWFRKHEEYKAEMNRVDESLRQHKQGNFDYVESGVRILELATNAYQLYSQQTALEQRRIVNTLLSNCTIMDGKLDYTYNKPFDLIAEGPEIEKISG
jgi:site-specific DNA recombinase